MTLPIGEKIRMLRLQNKLTQEQLADRVGVSYQSVSRWESGATYPDITLLTTIAKQFSVTTDYLLGKEDKEKRKHIRKQIQSISKMVGSDKKPLLKLFAPAVESKMMANTLRIFATICVIALPGKTLRFWMN